MKMKKLAGLALAACIASVTLLGACGSQKEAVSTSTASSSTTTATASTATTSSKQLSGKVVYWSMWNETEPQAVAFKKGIDMFKADYPDVQVDVQWMGRTNSQSLAPAIQAGEQIDIFDNFSYSMDPSLFLEISDLMNAPALGMDGKTVKESIIPALTMADQKASSAAGLTGTYGVAMSPWAVSFFYNKALFTKAGITGTPKTWDEFLAVCQKLVDAGIAPITCDDAYLSLVYSTYLSRKIGDDAVMKLAKDSKDPSWEDGGVLDTFKAMETLASKGYYSKNMPTNKYPAGQQEFALGQAAMYLNASWFPGEVASTAGPDFQWGSFPFPSVTGGKQDQTAVALGCIPMNVSSKTKNKEAVFEFLRYLVSKPVQEAFSEGGFAPCTIGSAWPKTLADQASMVESAQSLIGFGAGFSSDFINAVVQPAFTKVLMGKGKAQESYDKIIKERQTFVKKDKK